MNDVITYWNRGAEELYGWKSEQAVGNVTHELLQTQLSRAARGDHGKVAPKLAGGKGSSFTQSGMGRRSSWRAGGLCSRTSMGALSPSWRPITTSPSASRLRRAVRRQANLLEQTHDAIFVWRFPGTIIYWNRGAERLYGFSSEEAVGRVSHDLLRTEHPMPAERFEAMMERQRNVDRRADAHDTRRPESRRRQPARARARAGWQSVRAGDESRHHRAQAGGISDRAGVRELTRWRLDHRKRLPVSAGQPGLRAALGQCRPRGSRDARRGPRRAGRLRADGQAESGPVLRGRRSRSHRVVHQCPRPALRRR